MKLKANKDVYQLPPIGHLELIVVEDVGGLAGSQVYLVTAEAMDDIRRKMPECRGIPRYAVHMPQGDKAVLIVYPMPDTDGVLRVRYYPPMREA